MVGISGVYVSWAPNPNVKYNIMIMEAAHDFLLAKAEMLARALFCLVMFVYSNILFLSGVKMMYSEQILNQQAYLEMLIQQPPPVMTSTLAVHSFPTGHWSDNFCFIIHHASQVL